MKAIASVSVVPVRAENSDRAEIVTQLLFGESCDILEVDKNWTKIKIHFDGYEGWVDTKQVSPISDADFIKRKTKTVTENFINYQHNGEKMLLSIGSEIDTDNQEDTKNNFDKENLKKTALEFLNVPYLWGGRSFFGIDCSGFTQIVYKVNGVQLPRDAYQQAELGEVLDFIEEAEIGDLAFF